MDDVAGGGYMDLMTAEQAGHFLQSQANHQSGSLANGDLPHAHHTQATHNGHQVAAGLAQVTISCCTLMLRTQPLQALLSLIYRVWFRCMTHARLLRRRAVVTLQ